MDVLNAIVQKANDMVLLQPLTRHPLQHRVSLYTDDMVMFLHPVATDIDLVMDILWVFGAATGLKTNFQKSSVTPIRCTTEELDFVQQRNPCEILEFPCKYLVLPLSVKKLTKAQIQPIIDRLANQLPGWKADLMNRASRTVQVRFVMTSMVIYLAMKENCHLGH